MNATMEDVDRKIRELEARMARGQFHTKHGDFHRAGGLDPTRLGAGTNTLTVRKNSGANVGTRGRLNLIEGSNITLTVTDDGVDGEVDVTVTGAAGVTDHGALTGLADDDHPQYATDTDLTTHAGAADPHTGYVREADANWIDLTDSGSTTLHTHSGGAGHTIEENGTPLAARTGLNFVNGLVATDDAGGDETDINVDYAGTADLANVAATEGAGAATTVPRGDHVHALGIVTTKGDVLTYSTVPARLAVGANGTMLLADSAQTTGLKWLHPALSGWVFGG